MFSTVFCMCTESLRSTGGLPVLESAFLCAGLVAEGRGRASRSHTVNTLCGLAGMCFV